MFYRAEFFSSIHREQKSVTLSSLLCGRVRQIENYEAQYFSGSTEEVGERERSQQPQKLFLVELLSLYNEFFFPVSYAVHISLSIFSYAIIAQQRWMLSNAGMYFSRSQDIFMVSSYLCLFICLPFPLSLYANFFSFFLPCSLCRTFLFLCYQKRISQQSVPMCEREGERSNWFRPTQQPILHEK